MHKGIWIDHKQAVIITLNGETDEIKVVHSNVEKFGNSSKHADDINLRVFSEHINTYYDEVISYLLETDLVLLLGPGEAKGEFEKRLEKHNLDKIIAKTETADRMTEPQIAAKIKEYFSHHVSMTN
jgi:hypothetical protein